MVSSVIRRSTARTTFSALASVSCVGCVGEQVRALGLLVTGSCEKYCCGPTADPNQGAHCAELWSLLAQHVVATQHPAGVTPYTRAQCPSGSCQPLTRYSRPPASASTECQSCSHATMTTTGSRGEGCGHLPAEGLAFLHQPRAQVHLGVGAAMLWQWRDASGSGPPADAAATPPWSAPRPDLVSGSCDVVDTKATRPRHS